jgi:hypothetical protein
MSPIGLGITRDKSNNVVTRSLEEALSTGQDGTPSAIVIYEKGPNKAPKQVHRLYDRTYMAGQAPIIDGGIVYRLFSIWIQVSNRELPTDFS